MTSVGRTSTLASLDEVSVRFGDAADEQALASVSLDIGAGECVALLGPSGAGKSTLLAVLGGRQRPTAGRAVVHGVDLATAPGRVARRTRARIGMVAQSDELVRSISVHRNVLLGRAGSMSAASMLVALAKQGDVDGVSAALASVGVDELIDRTTDTLSGGQRQRVSIARVRYQDPALVLADEPVSNLDPTRSEDVLELMTSLVAERGDRSLVVSLHDPMLARRHCSRVIGIERGTVAFDLDADAVSDGMIASLYANEHRDADDRPDA